MAGFTIGKSWLSRAAAAALALPALHGAASAEPYFVSLGTGPFSGLYYPTGQAICDVVNAQGSAAPIRCSVEATPGSVYNVEAVASGEEEFALVQSDVQYMATKGEGRWRGLPVTSLRSVMSLYPELVTIIARPDAGINSVEGLKGKRVNIGSPGSGTRATWDEMKLALDVTEKDLAEAAELRPDAAAERICANTLDASLQIVGHPSRMVDAQLKACGLTILPVSGPAMDALVASKPFYVEGFIPAAIYGLAADTPTFGGKTTLVTYADVPDDVVYHLTMAVMNNLDKLRRQPALSGLDPRQMARQSLIAPLHPGAERAYRELGLLQ